MSPDAFDSKEKLSTTSIEPKDNIIIANDLKSQTPKYNLKSQTPKAKNPIVNTLAKYLKTKESFFTNMENKCPLVKEETQQSLKERSPNCPLVKEQSEASVSVIFPIGGDSVMFKNESANEKDSYDKSPNYRAVNSQSTIKKKNQPNPFTLHKTGEKTSISDKTASFGDDQCAKKSLTIDIPRKTAVFQGLT